MEEHSVLISMIPSESIPEEVRLLFRQTPGSVCRLEGKLYISDGRNVLCCDDNKAGNELFSILMNRFVTDAIGPDKSKDAWYQIISTNDRARAAAIAKKNGINEYRNRIVIIFRRKCFADQELYKVFCDIAPMEKGDHPVFIGRDVMAMVKETVLRNEAEIAEYVAAVIDTMVSEGFTDLQAGIGTEAGSIFELHRSFDEAMDALQTGTLYHANETLFRYSEQKLERIISQIPVGNRKKILAEYSSICDGEAISDEMMETVRVFFEHDLNITSASRQLFIHRNTLNYRLDKIKRDTGLDLRTFHDAVVFRLILEMKE